MSAFVCVRLYMCVIVYVCDCVCVCSYMCVFVYMCVCACFCVYFLVLVCTFVFESFLQERHQHSSIAVFETSSLLDSGCIDKDWAHMKAAEAAFQAAGKDVTLEPQERALIAVQGPGVAQVGPHSKPAMVSLMTASTHSRLPPCFRF